MGEGGGGRRTYTSELSRAQLNNRNHRKRTRNNDPRKIQHVIREPEFILLIVQRVAIAIATIASRNVQIEARQADEGGADRSKNPEHDAAHDFQVRGRAAEMGAQQRVHAPQHDDELQEAG